jgi:outer membrane receptor protein involved in Fe transport
MLAGCAGTQPGCGCGPALAGHHAPAVFRRRLVPAFALLAAALPAGEADFDATGLSDVELLDERAWVESVSRRRQSLASAPAPVEVVLYEDLARSAAPGLPDHLRYLPGVIVYQPRHGQHDVGLRGYNGPLNPRLLVLQDDWSFAIPELSATAWTGYIDYSDLDRVEIAKGPASVTYGANAFGGVIALRTRQVGDKPTFTAWTRAGAPGAYEGDATYATPLPGRAYLKLTAGYNRLRDLPGVESPVQFSPGRLNADDTTTDLEAWRARAVAGIRLGDGWTAEATARMVRFATWEPVDGMAYGPPDLQLRDQLYTAELRGPWLQLQHAERFDEPDYLNLKPDPSEEAGFPFLYLRYGFETHERITRARLHRTVGAHGLSAGAERRAWRGRSNLWAPGTDYDDTSTWALAETVDWGVFAEDQIRLGDGLLLSAGVRADRIGDSGTHASPRLALNWAPNPRSFALLSYSGGYRPPTILERFQRDTFITPSQDLEPESIHALELQWRYREGRERELSLGAFANRSNRQIWRTPLDPAAQQDNFLEWAGGGDADPGPQYGFSNLDNPATVLGAEAAARLAITGTPFTVWSNATWQRYRMEREMRFASPGFTIPLDPSGTVYYRYDYTLPREVNGPPEWIANLGLEWSDGPWFAGAAGRFVSSRTVYDIGHTRLLTEPYIALERVDGYAVLDLSLGWRDGPDGRRSVRLSVLDAFDSRHTEGIRTSEAILQRSNESQYTADLGRMVSVVASWSF